MTGNIFFNNVAEDVGIRNRKKNCDIFHFVLSQNMVLGALNPFLTSVTFSFKSKPLVNLKFMFMIMFRKV